MQTSRDKQKPLQKIRTFAQDLEDERAERAEHGTAPSPTVTPTAAVVVPQTPATKPTTVPNTPPEPKSITSATPKPEKKNDPKELPSVPHVHLSKKPDTGTPPIVTPPVPVKSTTVSDTPPEPKSVTPTPHTTPKTTPPPAVKTLVVPHNNNNEIRDPSYEATVITDSKHKRFRLSAEVVKSVKGWWKELQKSRAAKHAPRYTIPQADLRKGVIQQATSKTGRGSISDHSAVLARIRENTQSGKAGIASQIQIKHSGNAIIEPALTAPNVPAAPAPQKIEEELVKPTPVPAPVPPVVITPEPLPPTAIVTPTVPIVPEAPSIQTPTVTEEMIPQYQETTTEASIQVSQNRGSRGVDVYIPYEPTFGYQDTQEISEPEPIRAVSAPATYTAPIPTPLITTINPVLPNGVGGATTVPSQTDDESRPVDFLDSARNLLVDEGREITSWFGTARTLFINLRAQLQIKQLIQNPNHLVLAALVICSLVFIGYIVSNTVFDSTAEELLVQGTKTDVVLFSDAQKREVALIAPNRSALFGGITSQLQVGDTVSEIIFLDAAQTPISTTAFITVFYDSLDQNFIASIKSARFGTYRGTPWIAITTTDSTTAKGAMLAWEKTISKDLEPLFGTAVQNNNRTILGSFTDVSQGTVDTRVLPSPTGEERIVYGFVNRDTILITTSSLAFTNLLQSL